MLTKEHIMEHLSTIKPELQKEGITKLGLFGSFAKGKADITSDVDITIEKAPDFVGTHEWGGAIFLSDLKNSLEKKFGRKVDLFDTTKISKEKERLFLKGVIYV